jgi:hypothetical protein
VAEPDIQPLIAYWEGAKSLQYAFRWLYKDGLETGFYAALLERAPSVSCAIARMGYFEGFLEFADAMRIPDVAERNHRLEELGREPGATWKKTVSQVRPEDLPILEAWIDRCVNVEHGTAVPQADSPVGRRVRHKAFGDGTITAVDAQTAMVAFDNGTEKRLRLSFLEVLSPP